MTPQDITQLRLQNQLLSESDFKKPAAVVQWLGAVQAQDYLGAKWALGLRMQAASDETIEKAFGAGEILRTHVMRPTWHFVAPADIRWMLELTAPRVNGASSHYYRKHELDNAVFARSNRALERALRGGRQLTRDELRQAVQRSGVDSHDLLRFGLILLRAELDGVICSGARRGKQFTYALFDERVPDRKALVRDEALAKLTRRYFNSHGPATLQDFAWWSGLTTSDARSGLEMVQSHFVKEEIEGKVYWLPSSMPAAKPGSQSAYLLPPFDEYLVAYKDRKAAVDHRKKTGGDNVIFNSSILLHGQVVGSWKRTFEKNSVAVKLNPFAPLTKSNKLAIAQAAQRYGAFLGMTTVLID